MMRAVCIIPARAGSRRIPGKNLKEFHGRPIIAYSIEAAHRSDIFNMGVYVSTEDSNTANLAWSFGANVHVRRPEFAQNDIGTQEVMSEALKDLFPDQRRRPDLACCLYATAPLITAEHIRRGWTQFLAGTHAYAYSTGPDGKDAGAFYWGMTENFIMGLPLEGHSQHVVLPAERVMDINTIDDWLRAERMYAALHNMKERA